MRRCLQVILALALASHSFAQTKLTAKPSKPEPTAPVAADSSARLPVKRVVLYKNGVGYFEHTARVHGTQELSIDFTTSQLNDVLKSLTAVDLGDGRVIGALQLHCAP